ncbi:hypothetical protein GCM10023152_32920 [Agromyces bauzanensis]|uniref:Uncharacterized protein n=1 Tax=Agromyces bauzanensis TaxID=1308924 RepID=A0A917PW63_9MICO|nr:hypothetical protein GCM10011372_36250 [Agromyces bauzanensis]
MSSNRTPTPEGMGEKLTSEHQTGHPEGHPTWRFTYCDPTSENVGSKMLASTMQFSTDGQNPHTHQQNLPASVKA